MMKTLASQKPLLHCFCPCRYSQSLTARATQKRGVRGLRHWVSGMGDLRELDAPPPHTPCTGLDERAFCGRCPDAARARPDAARARARPGARH